ncbi:hypothetical protein K788_0001160 (plasmid) [Paraburkholderia caribensis MBA4]|uniref:Uncharacterized protein n=1 Tax=Paraburkholderia caribensis MBA4 TaxID=1323664 RepID=A0A0P0RNQ8_9BURK|nr:hypothetical protein K788_0001160 [Paraburkholderia caribensis MBA4]
MQVELSRAHGRMQMIAEAEMVIATDKLLRPRGYAAVIHASLRGVLAE